MRITQRIVDEDGKLVGMTELPDGRRFVPLDPKGQWGFKLNADGTFHALGRADSKFYEASIDDAIGYAVLVLVEEPLKAPGENVGTVALVYRSDGMILSRDTKGVDGATDIEGMPTSVSKGEAVRGVSIKSGARTNLKRISGPVDFFLYREAEDVDAPTGQAWMPMREFVTRSGDGRSLAAITAACTDPDFLATFVKAMAS